MERKFRPKGTFWDSEENIDSCRVMSHMKLIINFLLSNAFQVVGRISLQIS